MTQSLYSRMRGEVGIRALAKEFYRQMDALPEAQSIRRMHPQDLSTSEEKFFLFLSGWTGGPQLFAEKNGHPRLRMRHFPFAIGDSERDQWMMCMERALRELGFEESLFNPLLQSFRQVADHMRNRET